MKNSGEKAWSFHTATHDLAARVVSYKTVFEKQANYSSLTLPTTPSRMYIPSRKNTNKSAPRLEHFHKAIFTWSNRKYNVL